MPISIERLQSINERFIEKVKEYQLEEYEHLFVNAEFVHSFNMLFNIQHKRYGPTRDSEETEKLFQALDKYKTKPDSLIRKTEIITEFFKNKKIWSKEDKSHDHITLYLENESIEFPTTKNKAYLWAIYNASRRGGNDTIYYIFSYKPEDHEEAEVFLNLLKKFSNSFRVSSKTIHCVGSANIHLNGDYSWDDLVLPDRIVKAVKDDLEFWIKAEDLYRKNKLIYKRSYLMCGPPGNGKTATARVILSMYDFTGYMFSFTNKRLDDADLINMFEDAKGHAPALILLEDLDKSFDKTSFCNVSLECLLNCLDGISTNEGIVVIATANNPQLLDRSVRHRPGRFDVVIEFNNPDYDQRKRYLKKLFGTDAQISDSAFSQVVGETEGMSMAFVKLVYETAGARAFKRVSNGKFLIKDEDLLESLDMCLAYYEKSRTGNERKAGFKPEDSDSKRNKFRNRLAKDKKRFKETKNAKALERISAPFKNDYEGPFVPYTAEPGEITENPGEDDICD